LWGAAKVVFTGKFIVLSVSEVKKSLQINGLNFFLKKLKDKRNPKQGEEELKHPNGNHFKRQESKSCSSRKSMQLIN
jgi:hypothetical protein